jgi:hypothetical protein
VLVSKVFAPATNGLGTTQRDIVISPARTASHSARQINGALLWNHFKVSFMLFIPKKVKGNKYKHNPGIAKNHNIYCIKCKCDSFFGFVLLLFLIIK